jgi:hypothetical protein
MSDDLHITIVTDDPTKAFMHFAACTPDDAPKWLTFVSDANEIMRIRTGTVCQGLWFSSRSRRSLAEWAWFDRRALEGLVWLTDEDRDRVNMWVKRKIDRDNAAERRLALEGVTDSGKPISQPIGADHRPAAMPIRPEIENLILSQRWT